MVTDEIEKAINSEEVRTTLEKLNKYFYNRKHEGQIRDSILISINENSNFKGISEYPKCGAGAVDLSIFDQHGKFSAAIEFKHHYPRDLNLKKDRRAIISDITRTVKEKTSHFVLIVQEREEKTTDVSQHLKYMERNDIFQEKQMFALENDPLFPKNFTKKWTSVTVQDAILSKYTFLIYDFTNRA